jgi:predicted RNA-binding Zn-ribbon protein involved in translation (DUF1610 family)
MAKRKFCKAGETATKYRCSKQKCKWEGTLEEQKKLVREDDILITDYVCPKCGNNDFYGLL